MALERVLVLGLGKVGTLVAILLQDAGFEVLGLDRAKCSEKSFKSQVVDITDKRKLLAAMKKVDGVVSCLPYNMNIAVSDLALKANIHYFDLTEDVPTTNHIRKLAKTSKKVMIPQCGLAPGFIGIVGTDLTHKLDKIRSLQLRVGALPQHPRGKLGYAFNWSAEGVVNEYLNECEVISHGVKTTVPALENRETIVISGVPLEAFSTSGGLGTMCETFKGKVEHLNYKSIRYPGHCALMRFFFDELRMDERRKDAGDILVNAKPPVDDDVVYVHAAVEGWAGKHIERHEFVRAYYPRDINGQEWKAISWTTAASVTAVVEMVAKKKLPQKGFVKQESIKLDKFLATQTGSFYQDATS